MSLWLAIVLIVLVVTGGNVISSWAERSRRDRLPPSASEAELQELRQRVEELTGQVERLSTEQRFLTKLLEGRSAPAEGGASEHREPEGGSEWSRARTSRAT